MSNVQRICKNCKLFDPELNECQVIILHDGEKIKLPVSENDNCFYEVEHFDPIHKIQEDYTREIKQVRLWVEDENGKKTDKHGKVKIEYPEGFFYD